MVREPEWREESVDTLRSRMDAEARFHRALAGYDPNEVRSYLEEIKLTFAKQAKAAKHEQETLIADLSAAKTEIDSRNCAIKALRETISSREAELAGAKERIAALLQKTKDSKAEYDGYDRLRAAMNSMRASNERTQLLEREVQQLRAALSQANAVFEAWKTERTHLSSEHARLGEENARLCEELSQLRAEIAQMHAARDAACVSAMPSPANEYLPAEQPAYWGAAFEPAQPEPSRDTAPQLADRLANMLDEASALMAQLRSQELQREPAPQRAAQPRMQVLRPDKSFGDHGTGGK